MSIWMIVFLVVWVIGNIVWNYTLWKDRKYLCIGSIFQGFFAGIFHLVVTFSEWMEARFEWWHMPLIMSKELKEDIAFVNQQYPDYNMVIHETDGKEVHFTAEQVDKLGKELIEEIKKQAIKDSKKKSTRKDKK